MYLTQNASHEGEKKQGPFGQCLHRFALIFNSMLLLKLAATHASSRCQHSPDQTSLRFPELTRAAHVPVSTRFTFLRSIMSVFTNTFIAKSSCVLCKAQGSGRG
jgi:hypothetical protein